MKIFLKFFGSFGLACILLLCLFMLTLFGTLYQVDNGLYQAKQIFFNSWFLTTGPGIPVFPGGVLVMLLLTVNIIVGGIMRMKWRRRNAGVLVIHVGIIFMLVGGLVKLVDSQEGHLSLFEGEQSDEFISYHLYEVNIWEMTGSTQVPMWVIGDDLLTDLDDGGQRSFHAKDLPFTLILSDYLRNCNALPKGPAWTAHGDVIDGFGLLKLDPMKEAEGNVAGLFAEVIAADGTAKKGILWSQQRAPWAIEVDGRRFAIDFHHTAFPMPFTIRLDKFTKEEHPGTRMAKSYRSNVTRLDARSQQPVLIQMNDPLREGGLVLFQSSYGTSQNGRLYSVFSVVRNPSDKWPEYALWVITLGLVMAFGRHLLGFIRKQNQRRSKAAGAEA